MVEMFSLKSLLSKAKEGVIDLFNVYEELPVNTHGKDEDRQERDTAWSNTRGRRPRVELEVEEEEQLVSKMRKIEDSITDKIADDRQKNLLKNARNGKSTWSNLYKDGDKWNSERVRSPRRAKTGNLRSRSTPEPKKRVMSKRKSRASVGPDWPSSTFEIGSKTDEEDPFSFHLENDNKRHLIPSKAHMMSFSRAGNILSNLTSDVSSNSQTEDDGYYKDNASVDSQLSNRTEMQTSSDVSISSDVPQVSTQLARLPPSLATNIAGFTPEKRVIPIRSRRSMSPFDRSSNSPAKTRSRSPINAHLKKNYMAHIIEKPMGDSISWPLIPIISNDKEEYDTYSYLIFNGVRLEIGMNVYLASNRDEPYIAEINEFNLARDKKKSWCVVTWWYRLKDVRSGACDERELLKSTHSNKNPISTIDVAKFPIIHVFKNPDDVQIPSAPHNFYCYRTYDHKKHKITKI